MTATAPTDACPACGGALEPAFEVRGVPVHACRHCRTLVTIGTEASFDLYSGPGYYVNESFGSHGDAFHGYRDYLADRRNGDQKFGAVLAQIERLVGVGRLVDVGAGPGFLVDVAVRRGWTAIGVDVNRWAVDYASDHVGVEVHHGTLTDLELADSSFDAVTMLDLLEHVREPGKLVDEAVRVIRPGGVLCILTPDAGSLIARLLRSRWPEMARVSEHLVLFSSRGLETLLRQRGVVPVARTTVGKRSSVATLLADADPIAPRFLRSIRRVVGERLGSMELRVDPRGKVAVFAVRTENDAVVEDLAKLAQARRLTDWLGAQFAQDVRGRVLEVGAGIGTFTDQLLANGAESVVAVEPDPATAATLEGRFAADERVKVLRDELPELSLLAARGDAFDLVVCQNVLEHIDDDGTAVARMAALLAPGGSLDLLVPAHPALFGSLDRAYEHRRRYTRARVEQLVREAGLEMVNAHSFNALGIVGWWTSGRVRARRLDDRALRAFDTLVPVWRRIEDALKPPVGLSLVVRARRPG